MDYQAEYVDLAIPSTLPAGASISCRLRVANRGSRTWVSNPGNAGSVDVAVFLDGALHTTGTLSGERIEPDRAGTFYFHGELVFWDVRDPANTIIISMEHERYKKLIIEVADPAASVERLRAALPRR